MPISKQQSNNDLLKIQSDWEEKIIITQILWFKILLQILKHFSKIKIQGEKELKKKKIKPK